MKKGLIIKIGFLEFPRCTSCLQIKSIKMFGANRKELQSLLPILADSKEHGKLL